MAIKINTKYGRKTRLGLIRHTTIYLYELYREVYDKFVELANREGKSFSEMVSIAMKEYVELHYPGNPIAPLESFTPNGLKSVKLEAKLAADQIIKFIRIIRRKEVSENFKLGIIKDQFPKYLTTLMKLNQKIKDNKYAELIEQSEKIIDDKLEV